MSWLAVMGGAVNGGINGGFGRFGRRGWHCGCVPHQQDAADGQRRLEEEQSSAHKVGRAASYAGTAGGMAVVSAAGSVAGLSSVGITSGMAPVGSTVGSGMAAGISITTVAPVVAAAAVGYGIYEVFSWWKN